MIRLVWFLLLPVLLVLALPASAHAAWSAPVTLSPTGHSGFDPQVGIDQSGNAVVVWRRPDGTDDCGGFPSPGCNRIQVVARSATGALTAVETVSPSGESAEGPQLGVDPNGNALIAWFGRPASGCCTIQARARSAAGTLSDISLVGQNSGHPFQLGVDQGGNAVLAWIGSGEPTTTCGGAPCSIVTRTRSATGALTTTQGVASGGVESALVDLAVNQGGDSAFVWSSNYYDGTTTCGVRTPPGCARVRIRTRSASGALSTIKTLSANGQDGFDPHVAVDQSGNAVAAWTRDKGNCGATCYSVQTRARMTDGSLSATQTLSGKGGVAPEVAMDQSGNAVYVWSRWDGITGSSNCDESLGCLRVQARARLASGSLSSIQTLSAPGQDASNPHVAVDQAGNAVIVWERYDGTTDCGGLPGCLRVQTRFRAADGTLSATKTLSAPGGDARESQIALNPGGRAMAVWSRFGGLLYRVQAAVGP
jgi:hypothetical protein